MWFIASFLFTFQVCTTRFNNKNKVFWTFVCLVEDEWMEGLVVTEGCSAGTRVGVRWKPELWQGEPKHPQFAEAGLGFSP